MDVTPERYTRILSELNKASSAALAGTDKYLQITKHKNPLLYNTQYSLLCSHVAMYPWRGIQENYSCSFLAPQYCGFKSLLLPPPMPTNSILQLVSPVRSDAHNNIVRNSNQFFPFPLVYWIWMLHGCMT